MAADALSDVLKTVRLTGATFFDVVAKAPWVAELPPQELILPKLLPDAEHLIAYHVVTEGSCFANILGEEPIAVEAGEVIVFTKGDPHVLSSSPGMRADPPSGRARRARPATNCRSSSTTAATGRSRPSSSAAILACDAQPFNPLLDSLPPVIKAGDPQGSDKGWLGQFIRLATTRVGGETRGRRKRAGQTERAHVHRGASAGIWRRSRRSRRGGSRACATPSSARPCR